MQIPSSSRSLAVVAAQGERFECCLFLRKICQVMKRCLWSGKDLQEKWKRCSGARCLAAPLKPCAGEERSSAFRTEKPTLCCLLHTLPPCTCQLYKLLWLIQLREAGKPVICWLRSPQRLAFSEWFLENPYKENEHYTQRCCIQIDAKVFNTVHKCCVWFSGTGIRDHGHHCLPLWESARGVHLQVWGMWAQQHTNNDALPWSVASYDAGCCRTSWPKKKK